MLQVVYNNYDKSHHDLLSFSDVSILAIEVYKSLMNMNSEFMWKLFSKNPVQQNLRKGDIPYRKKKCRHKISSVKNFVTDKIIRHFFPTNFLAWLSENIN